MTRGKLSASVSGHTLWLVRERVREGGGGWREGGREVWR